MVHHEGVKYTKVRIKGQTFSYLRDLRDLRDLRVFVVSLILSDQAESLS